MLPKLEISIETWVTVHRAPTQTLPYTNVE